MTETTMTTEQPTGDGPELSGVDLARVALHQAREAAKKRGATESRTPRRRRARAVQRDGREPSGLGAVLKGLMADRAWDRPTAGGTVLDRWPDIAAAVAPQLPDHVQAVAFHPKTGQLDLRPDSPAYATQLRLITPRIVAEANSAVGADAVRTLRVLPLGGVPAPRTDPQAELPAALEAVPVKTREMASQGYQRALAAHRAVAPVSRVDPAMTEAMERQARAMRELRLRAFPEPESAADGQLAPIDQARVERRRQADASHAEALGMARAERALRSGAALVLPQRFPLTDGTVRCAGANPRMQPAGPKPIRPERPDVGRGARVADRVFKQLNENGYLRL
ncbi:DciA family protein [Streptomyces sp. JL7001]|uniref:DciA family protein n=1 Tax=Streptomyces sp. JL7001 TaxID=3445784 RepID=UPI003F7A5A0F